MPITTIALMLPVALLLAQAASSQTNLYAPLDAKIQQVRAGSSLSPADKEEVHRQRTALLERMIKRTGKQFAGQWSAEDQAAWYIYRVKLALIDPETYVLPAWVDDLPDGWVPEEPDICPAIRARCQQAPNDTHLMLAVLFPALQAGDFRYAADTFVRLEKADPLLADLFMDRIARQGVEQQAKYGGVYRDFLAVIAGYKNEQDRLASSGNTLEVLSTEPASPAVLGIGDRVSVRIRYCATSIDKPKLWCKSRPLDEVNMDEVYEFAGSVNSSTGVVTRWFQFNAPAKVDQIYATMTGDIPGETLLRISNVVDFAWVDRHADVPTNADFESVRSVSIRQDFPHSEQIRDVLTQHGVKRLRIDPGDVSASSVPYWEIEIGNDVAVSAAQLVLKACLGCVTDNLSVVIKSGDRPDPANPKFGTFTIDERIHLQAPSWNNPGPNSRETIEKMLAPGLSMSEIGKLAEERSTSTAASAGQQ